MKAASSSSWILGSLFLSLTAAAAVRAQIVPDNTLPDNSRVEAGCTVCTIAEGTRQGNNLFHSFQEFSVPTGGEAFFNNAAEIENILTRVTGNSVSNIDGLLRSNGTANLFLLNPNGVIFGPNARLDVSGSFLASTADAIAFPSGDVFSATNPTPPSALLTVNPNALLVNQLNPQPIINRSTVNSRGLTAAPGQSLAFVGGDIRLEGGQIQAPGGRVELGGIREPGTVGLDFDRGNLSLNFPDSIARANVLLNNSAQVNVRSSNRGDIAIHAQDFTQSGLTTQLLAGIELGLGFLGAQAGDIEIDASGIVRLDAGTIANTVRTGAIGNGGNIIIRAGTVIGTSSARLITPTFGQGNGGNVTINARDNISFDTVANGQVGGVISAVQNGAIGNSGRIDITTRNVSLTNGSGLSSESFGQGDAGYITINASDTVSFEGEGGAFSNIGVRAVGNGGNITITTGTLSLTNGSLVSGSILGRGIAGDITINARDTISVSGVSQGQFPTVSGINSFIGFEGVGKGGNVTITTGSFLAADGGGLSVSTFGRGDAGDIVIRARDRVVFDGVSSGGFASEANSVVGKTALGDGGDIRIQAQTLAVTNGAFVSADTGGQGRAGTVAIDADEVQVSGGNFGVIVKGEPLAYYSEISTSTEGATDRGGDIFITTNRLQISDSGVLNARTFGERPGGNIQIDANIVELSSGGEILTSAYRSGQAGNIRVSATDRVTLTGFDPDFDQRLAQFGREQVVPANASSGLFAQTEGTGQAGNIQVQTPELIVRDQAQILASTAGEGQGGSLTIQVPERLLLSNGRLSVAATSEARAGNLNITTDQLIADGSSVTVSNPQGQAGTLTIQARDIRLLNGAELIAQTGGDAPKNDTGQQGEIQLQVADLLLLRNGSLISAQARDNADGGNINIDAQNGFVVAIPNENSDIIASAERGNGGRINITAQNILGFQQSEERSPLSEINASSEFGTTGTISLNTPDVDPSRGLTQLPADVTDASRLVALGCSSEATTQANQGEFYRTGRGGIAPLPTDALSSSDILEDLQPPDSWKATTAPHASIREAQGWQVNERGEVVLLAEIPTERRHCGR